MVGMPATVWLPVIGAFMIRLLTIDNQRGVVGHVLQVLVDGHGLLAALDKCLRSGRVVLTGDDGHVGDAGSLQRVMGTGPMTQFWVSVLSPRPRWLETE